MARRKAAPPASPQATLSSAIKTARDIMRKDAGLSGEVDRIPQLAWIFFLKAFDDAERNREVTERRFRPAIDPPYRWRDWAADPINGSTGDELMSFVNNDLLPYLRGLTGTGEHDPRDVLAGVFKETYNRMLSGYLLRDVVNKVNQINFASSDDIHTMAHLYESMLREMRDAAGDSGEFYTPRPVIRFIVQQLDPKAGEVILDPACGTGGFLVEALEHVRPGAKTTKQRRELEQNLRGIEKKPLPYLLGMMNMLLHGLDQPAIVRDNALSRPVTQIRKADRVDLVMTNPPFGGEEEKGIQDGFPDATRTAETALLFLQLIMRSLKDGGRCGMVVPNGLLFGDGVAARIKQQLLTNCNLHTIVRLPPGVFAPYTDIPTNLLFFENTGRTKEVWFYELSPPPDRKKFSKTKALRFDDLAECRAWWNDASRKEREENEHAWRVPIGVIETDNFNLDRKNPHQADDLSHRPPQQLFEELTVTQAQIVTLFRDALDTTVSTTTAPSVPLATVLTQVDRWVDVDPDKSYTLLGVRWYGEGLFVRETRLGYEIKASRLKHLEKGDFVYNRLFAWKGSFALVNEEHHGAHVSGEFPSFQIDDTRILSEYLLAYFQLPRTWGLALGKSSGSTPTSRNRLREEHFLALHVPLPPLDVQLALVELTRRAWQASRLRQRQSQILQSLERAMLAKAFSY